MTRRSTACLAHGLDSVPSTLMIPLAARALGGKSFSQWDPDDRAAVDLLAGCDWDPAPLLSDPAVVLNVLWRTAVIKDWGQRFFAAHPDSTGLNLGAGLSSHFQWFDNGQNRWLDMDLTPVVALRQRLGLSQPPRCRNRSLRIGANGWWQDMRLPAAAASKPLLLLCEGVLMYLTSEQVHAVLQQVDRHAPSGSELLFDFISPLALGRPSWSASLAPTGAEFSWGQCDGDGLLDDLPRLRCVERRSVSEAYGFAGRFLESCWLPWTGGPLYGLLRLVVD